MRKFVVALLALFLNTKAYAYNVTEDFANGFYWSSLPVSMLVIDSDATRLSLMKRLVDEAVVTWSNVVTNQLWSMSAQQIASGRGNIIRWSNNFAAETGLDPSSILAVTIRYTSGPYIARSEIIVNGNNGINSSESNLRTVLLHELGHTLGLDHSQYSNAVMAANLTLGYTGLHSDDRQGISAVVGETLNRQAINYISPLAGSTESEETNPLSCGTVDMSGGGSSGGNGPGNMLISLVMGFMAAIGMLFRPARQRR